jgi:hypothetical protein
VLLTPREQKKPEKKKGKSVEMNIKPRVLESRASARPGFFRLSDGYQKVFSNDNSDSKMVVPVCGYAGHRRGTSSQNFFGKSYKETTI